MIELKFNLPPDFFDDQLREFEAQRVKVGVLQDRPVAIPQNKSKGHSRLKGTQYLRRKIKRQNKDDLENAMALTKLAEILDKQYGFISETPLLPNNADLMKVMDELKVIFNGEPNPRRIENAAIAMIRNPIIRMDYGGNSSLTVEEKGFDRPMVDTGTLFSNISAVYYRE